jgi:glycosyltransferase involved in cell wall biosynthesis
MLADGYDFDVIDAHYFFPDGVAAARLARRFGKPFVVTARGSDINLIAQLPAPRRMILDAARSAGRIIAVSGALKRAMVDLGIEAERIVVLRNGVDLSLFRPVPMADARRQLGLGPGRVVASVGNLLPEKGHDLVIRAVAGMDNVGVVIVGEGPERRRLEALAKELEIGNRVHFRDVIPQDRLAILYSAADVLALGSMREGWPNVLLEAMACGTPVVATNVGGVREIVTTDEVGRVVAQRDYESLARAIEQLLATPTDRIAVRRYAEGYGWEPVSLGQLELFAGLVTHDSESASVRR